MKKIFIISLLLCAFSCNQKTPQQKAEEEYNKEKALIETTIMRKEVYTDSLIKIAYGLDKYKYLPQNRLNAINLLKQAYPSLTHELDSVKMSILQGNY